MEKFTDILGAVRKDSGSTFRSCEPELIELMRQIDNMVEEKKNEWSEQMSTLQLLLQQKVDENSRIYQDLEALSYEVDDLRKEVARLKSSKKLLVTKYENTVKRFKDEVDLLKKKYDRLQKKTNKFQDQKITEFQNLQYESQNKTTEIGILQTKIQNLEEQERKYKMELESFKKYSATLEEQRENLSEKCKLNQAQLNRKQETFQNLEHETACCIANLETKVASQHKICIQQELEIESLKVKLGDLNKYSDESKNINSILERLQKENEKLKNAILKKNQVIQKYEKKLFDLSKHSFHSFDDNSNSTQGVSQNPRSPLIYDSVAKINYEEKIYQLEKDNAELHKRLLVLKEEMSSPYYKSVIQNQDITTRKEIEKKSIEDCCVSTESSVYIDSSEASIEKGNGKIPLSLKDCIESISPLSPASEFTRREILREEILDKKIKSTINDFKKTFE